MDLSLRMKFSFTSCIFHLMNAFIIGVGSCIFVGIWVPLSCHPKVQSWIFKFPALGLNKELD